MEIATPSCASPAEFEPFFVTAEGPESVIDHFRSVGIIRDDGFPSSPKQWLDNFSLVRPLNYVADISPAPLLIVHGRTDDTVDVSHAQKLYDKAGDPKRLAIVDEAGHCTRQSDEAMNIVIGWFKDLQLQQALSAR